MRDCSHESVCEIYVSRGVNMERGDLVTLLGHLFLLINKNILQF